MRTVIRWIFLWPFLLLRALSRRVFLLTRGYDTLKLRLEGSLPDLPPHQNALTYLRGKRPATALAPLLGALRRAERDPRLRQVVVTLADLRTTLARAQEVAEALRRVAERGKQVLVTADEYGLAGYTIALGGTHIVLSPPGSVSVTGVSAELTFFKGLLDKAGVRAHLQAHGAYKSAREPFTQSEPSNANLEMTNALVDDLYEQTVASIASSRRLTPDQVRQTIDQGPFRADQALAAGLIDEVLYADELQKKLEDTAPKYRPLGLRRYLALTEHLSGSGKQKRIALLTVHGTIATGSTSSGPDGPRATGARSFQRAVDALAKRTDVAAVVLRVNSPGGSALASDLMWRCLTRLREAKPVIVSMGDVAASGGYFVSGLAGVPIFANPATITGSIGVVGGRFDARELYDTLGITKAIVKRGARADYLSSYAPPTPQDNERAQQDIDAIYHDFVSKMARGRQRSLTEMDSVAQGRVWTGAQAHTHGLVDTVGGLMRALDHCRELLGIGIDGKLEVQLAGGAPRLSPWQWVFGSGEPEDALLGLLPAAIRYNLRMARDLEGESAFALLPFEIGIR